jgi:hypothetical protein
VGDREEYIKYSDKSVLAQFSQEEKKKVAVIMGKYTRGSKYVNQELYSIAKDLESRHGITNELDGYFDPDAYAHTDTRADLTTNLSPGSTK